MLKEDRKAINSIIKEMDAHNDAIGAGVRNRIAAEMDARHVHMVRNQGITVEAMCMMLTDMTLAVRRLRKGKSK